MTCWSRSIAACGRAARAGRRCATRRALGEDTERTQGDNIPLALLGWVAGCTMIWSALFTVGNFLYGRMSLAWMLLVVFLVSGSAVIAVMRTLWPQRVR